MPGFGFGISRPGLTPKQGSGVPAWAQGTDYWQDFTKNVGTLPAVADTHAATIYEPNAAGVYLPFGANVLTRTDLGLQTVPSRTNLFLNSLAPATQTVTVANTTQYTVSITGTGSVALSGAGTGTVTAGSPVTFTSSTTSLTCTISGSPDTCNVTTGAFAVPPIATAGAPATVNGNQQVVDLTGKLGTGVAGFVKVNVLQPWVNGVVIAALNDGGGSNDLLIYGRSDGNIGAFEDPASVAFNSGSAWAQGVQKIVFSYGPNFLQLQRVGDAAPAANTSITYPSTMTKLNLGGHGYTANNNTYLRTLSAAVKFGAQNASTVAAMLALAQKA